MGTSMLRLSASAAAARLGVSVKALRLYERHGLVAPERTPAGYRVYGPDELARAADIVALRALGLSLAQVASVLGGDARSLDDALAAHEAALDLGIQDLVHKLDRVRAMRTGIARGRMPVDGELTQLLDDRGAGVAFNLPWPWGGEWFEFHDIRPLNYIIGSLGSGKTLAFKDDNKWRLYDGASTIHAAITDAAFLSRVNNSQISFSKRDVLVCNVRMQQWQTSDGAKTEYEVTDVLEHRPAGRQMPGL